MSASPRRLAAWPLLLPALVSMGACTSTPTAPEGVAQLYVDEINAVLDRDPSELEKRVLEDYRVSDAELAEAQQAQADCLAEYGISIEFYAGGGSMLTVVDRRVGEDEEEAAISECEKGTTSRVDALYWQMRDNPEGRTAVDDWRDCLERHQLPDGAGLSNDQLVEAVYGGDFAPSEPQAALCVMDPNGELEMTSEEAVRELERLQSGEGVDTMTLAPDE